MILNNHFKIIMEYWIMVINFTALITVFYFYIIIDFDHIFLINNFKLSLDKKDLNRP